MAKTEKSMSFYKFESNSAADKALWCEWKDNEPDTGHLAGALCLQNIKKNNQENQYCLGYLSQKSN